MKIKLYFLYFFIVFCYQSLAQTPNWDWVKGVGGSSYNSRVATDNYGNVLMTGTYFSLNTGFDFILLSPVGASDFFIAKYDSSGNVIWAKSAEGSKNDESNSICTDSLGNIYVTGEFKSDTIYFGSTYLVKTDTSNMFDLFIAKYDSSGNILWAQKAGGFGIAPVYSRSISIDNFGNSYITGEFNGQIIFDTTNLISGNSFDVFIAKYDYSGNLKWAKSFIGTGPDYSTSIDAHGAESIYITGYFNGANITFGNIVLANSHPGNQDIFIAKFDLSGNLIWAQKAGGTNTDVASCIITDNSSNVYVNCEIRS